MVRVGLVALTLLSARPAWPCIVDFASKSAGDRMDMSREQALIVWDAAAHREHFIRKAEFLGNVPDFGFLVPTPDVPELAEADEAVFQRLVDKETTPVVVRTGRDLQALSLDWSLDWPVTVKQYVLPYQETDVHYRRGITDFASRSEVEVLSQQKVAGYQAAVLRADKASDLGEWLSANGYPFSPVVAAWVTPYVRDHWIITAFKIEGRREVGAVAPRLVRMSFKADQPVYPYREPPRDPSAPFRDLTLHLVATERLVGRAPAGQVDLRTTYSRPVDDLSTLLDGALPGPARPKQGWLTAIYDTTRQRPDGELFFERDASQAELYPTREDRDDHVTELVVRPLSLGLLLLAVGAAWRRVRWLASK
jgi:hypothetical protein